IVVRITHNILYMIFKDEIVHNLFSADSLKNHTINNMTSRSLE
ncbi:MAG: hypothetical protein JWQ38_1975, partial [Flavipsychrobacter sp.]|nr:hypothetical protein [Flavipsychrobacter sp.]